MWPVCYKQAFVLRLESISFFFTFVERMVVKSRCPSGLGRVRWLPQCLSAVVLHIIQSMTVGKRIGERMQPWCTPDLSGSHSDLKSEYSTIYTTVFKVVVKLPQTTVSCEGRHKTAPSPTGFWCGCCWMPFWSQLNWQTEDEYKIRRVRPLAGAGFQKMIECKEAEIRTPGSSR